MNERKKWKRFNCNLNKVTVTQQIWNKYYTHVDLPHR